jgi:hypothetical protein
MLAWDWMIFDNSVGVCTVALPTLWWVHDPRQLRAERTGKVASDMVKSSGVFPQEKSMRTTRFIGLNARARQLVSVLNKLESDTFTTGMHNEKIELGKWEAPPDHSLGGCIVREVIQYSGWSGGPFILTCLEADFGELSHRQMCQWVEDPSIIEQQFDQEQGTFWV